MAELFRFDFSGASLSGVSAAQQGAYAPRSPAAPLCRSFFHRPGRNRHNIPPAIRLAFLIVVSLTAGLCSFAVSKLIAPAPLAGANENILPPDNSSSKLKAAANLLPEPQLPVEKRPFGPRVSDSRMSQLAQLRPVDPALPAIPTVDDLPPIAEPAYNPERAYDPRPVEDVAVAPQRPPEPPIVEVLPPQNPLPPVVEKTKVEAPALELPPGPPEIVVEKTPDPKPFVPAAVEPPPMEPVAAAEDERILIYLDSIHHGDTPMLTTWKHLNLAAAFAAALAVGQTAAAQDDIKTLSKQIEAMNGLLIKGFADLNDDVKNLKASLDFQGKDVELLKIKVADIEKTTKKLGTEIDELRAAVLYAPVTQDRFEELKNRIKDLELKLSEAQTSKRISLAPATTNIGRIMLVNLYNEDLVFTVNGQTYRVPAGRSTPVENVPAGVVNYEMISPTWGRRANKQTNLVANETLTLTAQ